MLGAYYRVDEILGSLENTDGPEVDFHHLVGEGTHAAVVLLWIRHRCVEGTEERVGWLGSAFRCFEEERVEADTYWHCWWSVGVSALCSLW